MIQEKNKTTIEECGPLPAFRRVLSGLLLLWCVLPGAVAAAFCVARYAAQGEWAEEYHWVGWAFEFHTRAFYILGALLTVAALVQLFLFQPSRGGFRAMLRERPWHLLLLFLLLWATASTLLSEDPVTQILGLRYINEGLAAWLIYAGFYLAAALCGKRGRLAALRSFTGVAGLIALIAIGQVYQFPLIRDVFYTRPLAIFQNINYLGYYLCTSLCCLYGLWLHDRGEKRGAFYLLSFILQTYALLLNNTFGAYLGVLLALPLLLLYQKKRGEAINLRTLLPALFFLALSIMYYFGLLPSGNQGGWARNFSRLGEDLTAIATDAENAGSAGSGRFRLWVATLDAIAKKPILGYGAEGLRTWFQTIYKHGRPHNEPMQYAVFFGIPGMLAYLAALVVLFVRRWKALPELDGTTVIAAGGVTGYLISSMFGLTLYATAPFFFLLLGFCSAEPEASGEAMSPTGEGEPDNRSIEAAQEGKASGAETEAAPEGSAVGFLRGVPIRRMAALLLLLVVTGGGILYVSLLKSVEKSRENMDIAAWKDAYTSALIRLRENPEEAQAYWYDADRYDLIPAEEPPPAPYGMGTIILGQEPYRDIGGGYRFRTDYTDKILWVGIDPSAPEDEQITWEWVVPPAG